MGLMNWRLIIVLSTFLCNFFKSIFLHWVIGITLRSILCIKQQFLIFLKIPICWFFTGLYQSFIDLSICIQVSDIPQTHATGRDYSIDVDFHHQNLEFEKLTKEEKGIREAWNLTFTRVLQYT